MTLFDAGGVSKGTNDDISFPSNACSKLTVNNLSAGTYYVEQKRAPAGPVGLATYDYRLQIDLTLLVCGDGTVGVGEICDDGNTIAGDGCSNTCTIESGYFCSGTAPSVCIVPEIVCNDGIDNNGNGQMDAADPSCGLPAYFTACGAGQTLRVYPRFENGTPIPDDPTIFSSVINVASTDALARAALVFNATHPYAGDVDASLTPPGGMSLDISIGNGAGGDNFVNTLFDSTCATNISTVTSANAPFSNCYAPEGSLSGLNGMTVTGAWTLDVTDNYSLGDDGFFNNWTLVLCTQPPPVLANCAALHAAQPALPDGDYSIDPDGAGGNAPFTVRCDMTTAGGGWTLAFNEGTSFDPSLFGADAQTGYSTNYINLAYSTVPLAADIMLDVSDSAIVAGTYEHRAIVTSVHAPTLGKTLREIFTDTTLFYFDAEDNSNVTNTGLTCGSFGKWADFEGTVCNPRVITANDVGSAKFAFGSQNSYSSNHANLAGWPQNPNQAGNNFFPDNYRVWVR